MATPVVDPVPEHPEHPERPARSARPPALGRLVRSPDRPVAAVRRPLPWRALLLLALLGTMLGVGFCLLDLHQTEARYGGLIHTGPTGPAAALLRRELPGEPQFALGQHDGPMYYAVARDPLHLDRVSHYLDRPRYRLQHPLLSWLGWAAHPWGGGQPLVWTLFGVGVAAVFLGSVAAGALSESLGGPVWPALVFAVLPGAVMSLRITTGDALGVALMVLAIVASFRGHLVLTAVAAALAVLAKEPVLLGLVGVALWRRDRDGLALVVPPILVAGAWYVWLRIQLGAGGEGIMEFGMPFAGLGSASTMWVHGSSLYAGVSVVAALVLSVVALARHGWRHPLAVSVILQLAFTLCLTRDVIGLERNGTRMSLPLLIVALIMLITPEARERLVPRVRVRLQRPASSATTGASASMASSPSPT
jgi:hypothetical protein